MADRNQNVSSPADLLATMPDVVSLTPGAKSAAQVARLPYLVKMVPVSAIVETSSLQKRETVFDPDTIPDDAELLSSVRENGVIVPIMVQQLAAALGAPAQFRLVFGHRRLSASKMVGLEYIAAMVAPPNEPIEKLSLLTTVENGGRRDLSWQERAETLRALQADLGGITVSELARKTGVPRSTISRLFRGLENPILGGLLDEGMTLNATYVLDGVLGKTPDEQIDAVVSAMRKASHAQRMLIRRMVVDDNLEPLTAIGSVLGVEKVVAAGEAPAPAAHPSAEELPDEPASSGVKQGGTGNATAPNAAAQAGTALPDGIPGINDDAKIADVAALTGVAKTKVRDLIIASVGSGLDYERFVIACLVVANGGDLAQVVDAVQQAYRAKPVASLLRKRFAELQQTERVLNMLIRNQASVEADVLARAVRGK